MGSVVPGPELINELNKRLLAVVADFTEQFLPDADLPQTREILVSAVLRFAAQAVALVVAARSSDVASARRIAFEGHTEEEYHTFVATSDRLRRRFLEVVQSEL